MSALLRRFACLVVVALAGCAAVPAVRTAQPATAVTPAEVAAAPERHAGATVVWGGRILKVSNLAQATEVTLLAFPLDRRQQPRSGASSVGRFIALLPGYVERYDYPEGRFLTVGGTLTGTRPQAIDGHEVLLPLLQVEDVRRWPADYERQRPQWQVGIGLGVRIGIH
ncbi:MAG TPA: Slp family lipoprotein [Rhodanobacteraceae bacterium]|nr:Slp family lipoprotein [Rhodanobacteraceae bacterium]